MSRRAIPSTAPAPMADPLHAYRAKRNVGLTPEPFDGAPAASDTLGFVVQKHWASHLHYDFRLELDGTLKSWAVPKGPSLDPAVKRMAVPVEDHPLAYAGFEGTIPAGQYGAGRVIVWDAGTWVPLQDPRQGLASGHLKFELRGHKLRGRWALVRLKSKDDGSPARPAAWLLVKEKDDFALASAAYSVVDESPASVKGHDPANAKAIVQGLPAEALPCALPTALRPQLATLVTRPPPDTAQWLYEIKYDGYRLLVRHDAAGTQLLTRNGHDWTARLQPLQRAFDRLGLPPGWYDGEIVVPGSSGVPDFGALQQAFETQHTDDVVLYLFDVPYAAGHDLRNAPLHARRAYLQGLLAPLPAAAVRFADSFDGPPHSVLDSACRLGLEGVVAKRRGSPYRSSRSTDWLKLKCGHRQEFVIGGYTAGRGTRAGFGALMLGVHDEHGVLQYAGDVGTGFSEAALRQIRQALDAIARPRSPFATGTSFDGQPRWVAPRLVAEVSFAGWTRGGHVRHAVFRGLRDDQDPARIVREEARRLPPAEPVAAKSPSDRMRVTNPQRVIDTRSGTTKLELLHHYDRVGELMMKHLKGRPVSLLRAPAGVDGELFFQKHAPGETMPGIRQLDPALSPGHPPMLEVAGRRGLLSAAQWNVVEFHTHNAASADFDHPDRLVFDLDPGEGVPWAQVQQAAELVHAFLDQLGLASFLKTSGGKGLHVVVPVKRQHDWATLKGFAQAVVQHMAHTIPQRFVARSGPKNRVGRIFIDYLRNGREATTVCAWSARARPGLGISVPVAWSELPTLRGGDHWTLKTVQPRLAVGNEPWAGYGRAARGLGAAMAALGFASTPA